MMMALENNSTFGDLPFNETYSNYSFEEEGDEIIPFSSRPETYIVPVVFAIIFVVGVLGNGTLIVVFLRHRAMRNVPNT